MSWIADSTGKLSEAAPPGIKTEAVELQLNGMGEHSDTSQAVIEEEQISEGWDKTVHEHYVHSTLTKLEY